MYMRLVLLNISHQHVVSIELIFEHVDASLPLFKKMLFGCNRWRASNSSYKAVVFSRSMGFKF